MTESLRLVAVDSAGLDQERRSSEFLPWLIDASRPYCDSMFTTEEELALTIQAWSLRKSSELWSGRGWLGVAAEDEIVGGFVLCPGRVLATLRQMDALAYLRSAPADDTPRRRAFLEKTSKLFGKVEPDDLYLSRIGVLPSARQRGYGRALMRALVGHAEEAGAQRISLDVSAANSTAISLYQSLGFQLGETRRQEELDLCYVAMHKAIG